MSGFAAWIINIAREAHDPPTTFVLASATSGQLRWYRRLDLYFDVTPAE
jgi:hypothetical protein